MISKQRSSSPHRRGAALVVTMICLMLVVLILGSLLKLARTHRVQMQREELRLQVEWLAESSLTRAAGRLRANANYTGELWEVSAADPSGKRQGRATITVTEIPERANERSVKVEAVFPVNETYFAKRTKQITVRLATQP